MHGNVYQWCDDRWDGAGSGRVVRGGCWRFSGRNGRAAGRSWSAPPDRDDFLGFRLARVRSGQ
jgi:formylglycine-generating enzyme required for sulfatase activity